jgi:hypothetical protein
MARNKIEDLRNHLFEVIEKLQDGEIDIETAKTIANVGGVIIESAKVEVAYLRTVEDKRSNFIPIEEKKGG